jgi:hypothetical protein
LIDNNDGCEQRQQDRSPASSDCRTAIAVMNVLLSATSTWLRLNDEDAALRSAAASVF